ncbi:2-hydroxy-3-oxopropionate reductase (EC [uncultured Gammaproteobacteria bacterium]|jgi:3-hydroxyisobutyrate dehydrogenase|nr:2-hydroxy-3-oxopropionate reductase (EC 1.1.1.60) [uncultured Gammaproteobacteria bacterium]CAC9661765.1 2-hydroxy-3-oxopropionate reductase (EC 1.1.1.60) [uncultured Gammaproteobacteria bacterium]VVH51481.1 2-hydroxy-3-oxopropionate reductase (EC [uncultured Gammaproteobacteria bacterium]
MKKITNITFIGLGVMGFPMAGHLSKNHDFSVTVWNRTITRAEEWADKYYGSIASSIKNAIAKADMILICAGKDEDVEEIIYAENGMLQNINSSIVIDHTTTSHKLAQKLAASFKEKDIEFIDAPVSGGEIGAINAQLSIMAGGNEKTIQAVNPVLKHYAKNITQMGSHGYGQLAKMVNQICIAGVLQGLSDGILFAESENIDIEKLLSAISGGAAQSWQMENRALTMSKREFDFGFAIKWMVKDLGYCLDRTINNKTDLSFTKNVYDKYQKLMKNGDGNLDTSALILQNKGE